MAFQIITGSQTTLPASMSVAAQSGWLVFGSVNQSGSVFSVLMGRGDGVTGLVTAESGHYRATGSSILSIVYPPTSSLGINTNPNVISVRT